MPAPGIRLPERKRPLRHIEVEQPEPAAIIASRKIAFEKVLKDRGKLQRHITAANAERSAKQYELLKWDAPKGYEYPSNPFSWKKFSIFGEHFDRVWFPARAGLFLVTLPFRLVMWPISFGGRFTARTIARYQSTRANFLQKARELSRKEGISVLEAKRRIKKQDEIDRQYRESAAFKTATGKKKWSDTLKLYGDAVEAKKVEEAAEKAEQRAPGKRTA